MSFFEPHVFHSPTAQIAYDVVMPASTETTASHLLVCINGYRRPKEDFRAFRKRLQALCPHLATLALDNRGMGQTTVTHPDAITLEDMSQDVLAIIAHEAQKRGFSSWSLLGISMGGMIAQITARKAAQQPHALPPLTHLFLVSTTAGGEARTWPAGSPPRAQITFHKRSAPRSLEEVKAQMKRYFGSRFLEKSPLLFDLFCKNIHKSEQDKQEAFDPQEERQFYASLRFEGAAFLKQLGTPHVLIYTGDEDDVLPLQNSQYLHQNIPHSRLQVYPQVGHLILIEEPEIFARDIADALA